jgi:hypothetical protein
MAHDMLHTQWMRPASRLVVTRGGISSPQAGQVTVVDIAGDSGDRGGRLAKRPGGQPGQQPLQNWRTTSRTGRAACSGWRGAVLEGLRRGGFWSRAWSQFWSHSPPSGTVRRRPPGTNPGRSRTVAAPGGRWPTLLESVLGETPQEFESPILRHPELRKCGLGHCTADKIATAWSHFLVSVAWPGSCRTRPERRFRARVLPGHGVGERS